MKALLPVGAAAAITAAFNSPLAAVLFSLEEIVSNVNAPILGSVVLASATAWLILRLSLLNAAETNLPATPRIIDSPLRSYIAYIATTRTIPAKTAPYTSA